MARHAVTGSTRKTLLDIAVDYERLAAELEAQLKEESDQAS